MFACKKCKNVFRKDLAYVAARTPHTPLNRGTLIIASCSHYVNTHRRTRNFDDADEYCPHCDNKYIIEAEEPKDTTKVMVMMEMEDARTKNTQLSPEEEAELNSLR